MINKIFAKTHILSKECQKVNLHLQTILDFATATQVSLSEDKDDFENFFNEIIEKGRECQLNDIPEDEDEISLNV